VSGWTCVESILMDSTTVFSEVDEHGYLNGRKNPFWWPTEFGIKAEIETSIGSSGVHALFVRGKENLPVDTLYKLIPADSYKATMWEVKEATVAGLASPITTTERNCDTLVVKPRSLIERELAHYAIYTYTPTWTPAPLGAVHVCDRQSSRRASVSRRDGLARLAFNGGVRTLHLPWVRCGVSGSGVRSAAVPSGAGRLQVASHPCCT
jgi:hypothetical protein